MLGISPDGGTVGSDDLSKMIALAETLRSAAKSKGWKDVDSVLEDLGVDIDLKPDATAEVTMMVPLVVKVPIISKEFAGLNIDQENELLLQKAAKIIDGAFDKHKKASLGDLEMAHVARSNLIADVDESLEVPTGYLARYTSNDGRVLHLIPEDWITNTYQGALCLGSYSYDWTDESLRAEDRLCYKCMKMVSSK